MIDLERMSDEELARMAGVSLGAGGLEFEGTTGRSATNNNPLNLEFRPGSYQDKYGAELEPVSRSGQQRFAKFRSMEDGYRAGLDQIRLDQSRGHTLATFVKKFAPPHENPTAEITAQYARELGVNPDTPLAEIPPEKLIVPMLKRESSTRIVRGGGSKGFMDTVAEWLGPNAAEAADGRPGPGNLEQLSDQELARIAGVRLEGMSDQDLARIAGVELAPPSREEFMAAVQGAGLFPAAGGGARSTPRPPGIYHEERGLWESVKDYLGYRELPQFLPRFNQESGLWEAQEIYEARRLYHGWDDDNEMDRVIYHGIISPLTLGVTDWFAKELTAPVPAPGTMAGAVGAGALGFATFMQQPFNLAHGLLGTRLAPTRSGLRGVAQLMAQGGATLGLATSISSLFPAIAHHDGLTEMGLEFAASAASGALIGALFPVAGVVPTKTMRLAVGLAALDVVKTRFHAAPDQGWFTLDDIYRGVRDGSIDRTVLAQKTFDYLLDLYFLAKTPSMRKQLESLKMNALVEEAAKASPGEAEEALVAIGKAGDLEKQVPGAEKQGPGVRGQGSEAVPQNLEPERGLRPGEGDPNRPGRDVKELRPWELTAEEYGARQRALTPEGVPEPSAAKLAKRREQDVRQALKRGEAVPAEVLADYPEMQGLGVRDQGAEAVPQNLEPGTRNLQPPPEPPDYAFIEKGDLIVSASDPQAAGAVVREAVKGRGEKRREGFVVEDLEGKEHFIPREEARLQELGAQFESAEVQDAARAELAREAAAFKKMYGGGPGVEEIRDFGRQLADAGKRLVDWIDVRLEKNLPPELRDPDVSKTVGSLLLKIMNFEDIGRTYPAAWPTFQTSRDGLALKTRHAAEFYQLSAPYLTRLTPEMRANVDRVLVELDLINDPTTGDHFRLGNDIDRWRTYLLNPREDIREKGVQFFMSKGLTEAEAEGAFGARMALDYGRAVLLDNMTKDFHKWLEGHGFDPARIKDIVQWTLYSESKAEEVAKAYFGPDASQDVVMGLERFRRNMNYWLKENHAYIPHSRYGEYFLRVIDTNKAAAAKAAYKKSLAEIDRRYPQDKADAAETVKQATLEFMEGPPEGEGRQGGGPAPRGKLSKGDRLRQEAREAYQDALRGSVVFATAAEGRAQYHEKRGALEAEFPADQGFLLKETLNKQLPMEIWAETHIPRVWTIISEAANQGKMPQGAREAMIAAWQDFSAAKGFGSHYIKRANVPGYETDLMRPLTDYLAGLAGYIGKMEKIRGFSEAFPEVAKQKMPVLLRHLNEYANYQLSNPREYESIRNVIYHWTLGGNISFHLINSLQNLNTGWAVLGTAGPKPGRTLAGAMKDWGRFMATGEGLREGEEAVLARARYEPELAPSGVGELSGAAYNPLYRWLHNDPTTLTARALDVFKGFWGGSFVEQMNRESFFLAAWRATGDYDRSLGLVRQAHFLYGKETRPSIARGGGSIPFIFMTYTTNYLTLIKNFAKAVHGVNPEVYGTRVQGVQGLTRMFAAGLMTAGLMGTGLYPIATAAWEKVFGTNMEEEGKAYLQEEFGVSQGTAERLTRGAVAGLPAMALGIDIGSRIAPNLPMTNLPSGDLTWQNMVGAALGAGSIPLQVAFGVGKAVSQGDYLRALEAGAPVSVRNLLAAIRLHTQGATTLKGQPIFTAQGEPLKLDLGETVRKSVGLQPARLAEHYRQKAHARRMEEDVRGQVQDFAGDLARAIRNEDEEGFRRTVEAWIEHNNRMLAAGRYADVIEPQRVEQAVKMRFRPQYPDVSKEKMILRGMGRGGLAETISPEMTE